MDKNIYINNNVEINEYIKQNIELLYDKKIIFGLSGGIAAYKAANIISFLRRNGAQVHVVMTKNACEFISPLTMKTLSNNKVITHMFPDEGYVTHISLTEIVDLFIVAPATANIIAKFANGIADDMLSTMYLAYRGKVLIVPSMNDNMFSHPATQNNIKILKERGNIIIDPEEGKLATGKIGKGRFPKDEIVLYNIINIFEKEQFKEKTNNILIKLSKEDYDKIKKTNVLVTLGATRSYIDPVRFISNPSSGKMGYWIYKSFKDLGFNTYLIAASYNFSHIDNIEKIKVETSEEMLENILKLIKEKKINLIIMTAAVSDFKVKNFSTNKIKRENSDFLKLELEKDVDIIKEIKKIYPEIKIVGFAAETNDEKINGKEKLIKKGIEAICINKVNKTYEGFDQDINTILYIDKFGNEEFFEKLSKKELGNIITNRIIKYVL